MNHSDPNVVVLIIDALRPDYLDIALCPTLMDLATEGVHFRQAFSTINTTEPSLTAFYTGDYPRTTGLIRHGGSVTEPELRALNNATFLQERLQRQGYTTTAVDWIGDYHERGYDHYSGELVGSTPSAQQDGDRGGPSVKDRLFESLKSSLSPETFGRLRKVKNATLGPAMPAGGWLPDPASAVVDHAIERVENSPEPFYLFCHFWDTHAPYEVPDEYLNGFEASDPEDRYRAAISFVDDQIARLLAAMEDEGVADDTLVIAMGDHGESFGEHGIYFDHHGLYDPSIRVPIVLHHPDLPSGERIDAFVQHVDLCPTIMDFVAGTEIDVDGESLLPLIRGEIDAIRDHIVAEEAHTQRRICLRTDRYKYIELLSGSEVCRGCGIVHGGERELYDLDTDPGETNNIVDDRPDVADSLRGRLYEWMRDHGSERLAIDRAVATLDDRGAYDLA